MLTAQDQLVDERFADPSCGPHDLDAIDAQICRLFALVVDGLAAATDAYLHGDRGAAAQVATAEVLVDELHHGTEALLDRQLAAVHDRVDPEGLARLVLALRIAPELERSGDLVDHIASRASARSVERLPRDLRAIIDRMSELGLEMWRRAAGTFGGVDVSTGDEFRRLDDELDDLHRDFCERVSLLTLPVAVAIELGLVARFYERLGDHAVNVARRVDEHDCRAQDRQAPELMGSALARSTTPRSRAAGTA